MKYTIDKVVSYKTKFAIKLQILYTTQKTRKKETEKRK